MLDALRHLASFAGFAAQRTARERHDAAVQRELCARPLALPRGLELTWLGTAGYRLRYQGQSLYIDPYLSRVPLSALLRGQPALSDAQRVSAVVEPGEQVAGILVGHCHFDHAIDAPEIARRCHAQVYGSQSLARLMQLHGLHHLAVEVRAHQPYDIGPYKVSFAPSAHSKLVLGHAVPYDGEFSCEHVDALSPAAYRCGQVWGIQVEVAGIRLYHQGSANLVDDEVRARNVDVFLAGIAGRRFTRDYWARILGRLQPRVVVASHYDDFFRPLDAPPGFSANVNLSALPEEIGRVSREFSVVALQPLRPVTGA
ncbi:MAG TPA: MBL fold metallo-hydrolase [Nevskiaceae bacterium]|nr:MBL fold metallo-hydrolase [Nevskiaceae bacterium]